MPGSLGVNKVTVNVVELLYCGLQPKKQPNSLILGDSHKPAKGAVQAT